MKPTIGLTLFMGLMMTSLVNCSLGAPIAPRDTGAAIPTRMSTVAKPANPQQGTITPISPTQVITENKTISEPQVQPPLGGESTESVKLAKQDLALRLGVSVDSVTVAAVIGQEFSTDAFNCRTAKERIAKEESLQVVLGQSILLNASGRRYEYHASGQTVIFCRPLP